VTPSPEPRAHRWYARLLRLYPASDRLRFAEGMQYAFAVELEAARRAGAVAQARFWLATLSQTLLAACAARLGPRRVVARSIGSTPHRRSPMLSTLTKDLRDAWRALRASPLVSGIAAVSLALGIGANTAIFSVINSLLLTPLPVREPSRLVMLENRSWTNPIWEAIRDRQAHFADGAFAWSAARFNLAAQGEGEFVDGLWVSGAMFDVLGVPAILGRTFGPADDMRGAGPAGPVAVISHGFWQRRFGGDPQIIGRTLAIERVPYTIVGVTPAWFFGPEVGRRFDIAVPIGTEPLLRGAGSALDRRTSWWLRIMARLPPGQTVDTATQRLTALQPVIRDETMPENWGAGAQAGYLERPFALVDAAYGAPNVRRRFETPLLALMGVVGVVLLIACGNIANLLLARSATRRHEFSVRLALGASRARLGRQLLAESLLLAAGGAALGLVFAQVGAPWLVDQLAADASGTGLDLSLDWRVLGFTAAVGVATAMLFGIAPAFATTRVAPSAALQAGGRSLSGDGRSRIRQVMVVGQVALSLALVVAAGLFAQTFARLATLNPGFDPDPLVVVNASFKADELAPDARLHRYLRIRDAVAAVPGVADATASFVTPVSGSSWNTRLEIPGGAELPEDDRVAMVNYVLPGWFRTYGTALMKGRDFTDADSGGAPNVAIVNEALARRFFASADAYGRTVREPSIRAGAAPREYRIVGVVRDAVYLSLREPVPPTMYLPMRQFPQEMPAGISLTVRSASASPARLTRSLAEAIGREAPMATLTFRPFADRIALSLTQERVVAVLSGFSGCWRCCSPASACTA
jgi:predicted permease